MKKIAVGFLLLLALVAQLAFGVPISVINSKHNLSSIGTGSTIRSTSESQVCVFCHTPHGASNLAPLWNRADTGVASYQLYTSPTLIALGYTIPASPGSVSAKSRLCLSCHDGTVAIGQVANRPGPGGAGTIPDMVNVSGTGMMPLTAAGNLGVKAATGAGTNDLSDDHPVGYLYKPGVAAGQDPELHAFPFVPAQPTIKLEPNTVDGTVECLTCHNPHNNEFPKFLNVANPNTLCTTCHNRTGYNGSGHQASGQAYTPPFGGTLTTVGAYSCASCHKPHGALGVPLLRAVQEATCFNGTSTSCHGGSSTAVIPTTTVRLDIQTELGRARRHPIQAGGAYAGDATVYGTHQDVLAGESDTQLGGALAVNRHVECPDCHNPHRAQTAARKTAARTTSGYPGISKALLGTWGVEPTTWPTPPTGAAITNNNQWLAASITTPASYTKVNPATNEYQVCLKCHSGYVTLNGRRDIAQEINPNNSSYHGIVPLSKSTNGQVSNAQTLVNTTPILAEPWQSARATTFARVWCSDCHGNAATTTTSPLGPHGSSNTGTGLGTSNTDKMLRATIVSDATNGTPLCLLCHLTGSTWTGSTGSNMNRHGQGNEKTSAGCFLCHMYQYAGTTENTGGKEGRIIAHGMNNRFTYIEKNNAGIPLAGNLQMNKAFIGGQQTNTDFTNKTCTQDSTAMAGGCAAQHTAKGPY